MINFFLKKSAHKEVFEKLSLLPLQFTMEQKSAIVVSLLELAKVDGIIPEQRFHYLEHLIVLLQLDENSWLFKEIYDADSEKSLIILRKLWDNQKEWYVMMVYGLNRIGRKAKGEDALRIAEEIGVEKQKYRDIVNHL